MIEASRFSHIIVSLFSFSGRVGRREYLKALGIFAVPVAVMVVASIIVGVAVNPADGISYEIWVWFLVTAMFCILAAPVSIRRLHDINISGIWYLIIVGLAFIPVLGIIMFLILSCIRGMPGNNDYDNILRISSPRTSPRQVTNSANHTNIGNRRVWQWGRLSYWNWVILIVVILKLVSFNHKRHIKSGYSSSWCPYCMIRQQCSDTSRQNADLVFSEVRDLEDVVTRNGDHIRNNCLYKYSGYGLKIQQVIEGRGVLVKHKDWLEYKNSQDIFIRMNTPDLVDGDPLPPVTVIYDGILRYTTVWGAECSVRAFKVVKKYKVIPR